MLESSPWGGAEKGNTGQTGRLCSASAVVIWMLVKIGVLLSWGLYSFLNRVHTTNANQCLLYFRHWVSAFTKCIYSRLNMSGGMDIMETQREVQFRGSRAIFSPEDSKAKSWDFNGNSLYQTWQAGKTSLAKEIG